ncbi:unnamed protein product [Pylaiella littoralis]
MDKKPNSCSGPKYKIPAATAACCGSLLVPALLPHPTLLLSSVHCSRTIELTATTKQSALELCVWSLSSGGHLGPRGIDRLAKIIPLYLVVQVTRPIVRGCVRRAQTFSISVF